MAKVKKVPRRERGKMRIFSTVCGTKPQDTDIVCWVPHEDAMKVVRQYERLRARVIREHARRNKFKLYNGDELKDNEYLNVMAKAHNFKGSV